MMMDQESLAQIQEIVGAATASLRTDIATVSAVTESLRTDVATVGAATESLRTDIATVSAVTESLRTDVATVSAVTESLRTDVADVVATTESLRTDIADARRHTGVLTEGLRHELQLVAEGFQLHLGRHVEERTYLDEQFRETRALIQLSYDQIQERVERLEERVRLLTRPTLRNLFHPPTHRSLCDR